MNSRDLKNEYFSNDRKKIALAAALFVAGILVCIICVVFVTQIKDITKTETERYLMELSDSLAYSVSIQMDENLKELQSISMAYTAVKENAEIDISYFQQKAELFDFSRISIIAPDGSSVGSDGFNFDFSGVESVMGVFGGKPAVCNGIEDYSGTNDSFIYAVPIYEHGRITGVMASCNTSAWLSEFQNQKYFGGSAFFHIFEKDGTFVTHSENQNVTLKGDNVYNALGGISIDDGVTAESVRTDVNAGKTGYIYFTPEDRDQRIMFYRPIDGYDFYISIIVLRKAASKHFDTLLHAALAINIFIVILYVTLIILLFIIYRRSNKQLSDIAFVDRVTNGASHLRFEMEAEKCLHNAKSNEYSFLTINVTKFKLINDAFGNVAGNRVLKHVYNMIRKHIDKDELVCRYESDKFDILIKSMPDSDIIALLHNISEDINSFNRESGYKYYISLTAGVYNIEDPKLPIISIRDRASMARKNGEVGSSRHMISCVFYSDMERRKQHREKRIENKMESALKNGDFVVYLQPKVSTSSRDIIGAEALVRWKDKEFGLIPPDDFIPFFEKNGFIIKLDLYVFEQVCKYIRNWIEKGVRPVPVSINLSRRHLDDPDFLKKYIEVQKKYGIPSDLIEIELTETLVFENFEQIVNTVNKIHEQGYKCSLDDFGSGYSSLNMLKDIKVDTLKLDREFFRTQNVDNIRERAIIESVVNMAKKLNMATISEGIETMYQLDFLESINCDMAQGFVISKPVPIDMFENMVFGRSFS